MHAGPVSLRGRPEAVDGTSVMYCPRRTVLDKLLVDAARTFRTGRPRFCAVGS